MCVCGDDVENAMLNWKGLLAKRLGNPAAEADSEVRILLCRQHRFLILSAFMTSPVIRGKSSPSSCSCQSMRIISGNQVLISERHHHCWVFFPPPNCIFCHSELLVLSSIMWEVKSEKKKKKKSITKSINLCPANDQKWKCLIPSKLSFL